MTQEEKERIGLVILDTLYEYLTEKEIQGDVILESQFDDIADDLINKLFIHNVSNRVSDDTCMIPNCQQINSVHSPLCKDHR